MGKQSNKIEIKYVEVNAWRSTSRHDVMLDVKRT